MARSPSTSVGRTNPQGSEPATDSMLRSMEGVRRVLGYSKKDLLLFDGLYIMGLARQISESSNASLIADCEFLGNSGYLIDAPDTVRQLGHVGYHLIETSFSGESQADFERWLVENESDAFEPEPHSVLRQMLRMASVATHPSVPEDELLPERAAELVLAFVLSSAGHNAVSVLDRLPGPKDWDRLSQTMYVPRAAMGLAPDCAVVELVLSNLPLPGDDVPLNTVLEFSADEETRRKLAHLNIWMRRAVQSGRDLQDLGLEVEESLHEFASHMRLADMRSTNSGVRIALSIATGVVEELLHLRPKGALDVVFEYRDRKATRLEAELSAPGGALAYIYEAKKRFAT